MNLKNILWVRNTGKIVPDAPIGDNLFGMKLSGGGGVITTATGNPVSIVTNKAQNAISTILSYSPRQSGSGDPSPQNIRPIEGWTEANLLRSRNNIADSAIQITPIQSGSGDPSPTNIRPISTGLTLEMDDHSTLTVWGGLLNPHESTMTITHDIADLGTCNWVYGMSTANGLFSTTSLPIKQPSSTAERRTGFICSKYKPADNVALNDNFTNDAIARFSNYVVLRDTDYGTDASALQQSLNGVQFVYELATPQEIQLSQTELARAMTALEAIETTANLGGTYYGFSIDGERGVLRVTTVCKIPLPAEMTFTNGYLYIDFLDSKTGYVRGDDSNVLCSIYKSQAVSTDSQIGSWSDYSIGRRSVGTNRIVVKDSTMTAENYESKMADVLVAYELATPIELPLTPQTVALLSGANTLWTDGDEISITYKAKR